MATVSTGTDRPEARERGPAGSARRRQVLDVLLTLVLLVIGVVGSYPAERNQIEQGLPIKPLNALGFALIIAAAAVLVVRRRWPVPTLAVVAALTTTYLVIGYPYGPIMLSFAVAVYTVANLLPLTRAAWIGAGAFVLISVHVFTGGNALAASQFTGLLPAAGFVAVPFAIGLTNRVNREATARNRADEARRIADDERLRIAQEVHDVVGHGLAAINMQAEIALHLLPRKPEEAEAALTRISRSSKDALDELRVTLAAVRQGSDRAPTPGLAQLPALRDRLTEAGLPVALRVAPDLPELPLAVDLAAYRVVQESLTNVLRHAGSATAVVRVARVGDALEIEVTDTGRGVAPGPRPGRARQGPAGHGLAGMRERVDALGGTLVAGPMPGGGFRVHAVLPVGVDGP